MENTMLFLFPIIFQHIEQWLSWICVNSTIVTWSAGKTSSQSSRGLFHKVEVEETCFYSLFFSVYFAVISSLLVTLQTFTPASLVRGGLDAVWPPVENWLAAHSRPPTGRERSRKIIATANAIRSKYRDKPSWCRSSSSRRLKVVFKKQQYSASKAALDHGGGGGREESSYFDLLWIRNSIATSRRRLLPSSMRVDGEQTTTSSIRVRPPCPWLPCWLVDRSSRWCPQNISDVLLIYSHWRILVWCHFPNLLHDIHRVHKKLAKPQVFWL